MLEPEALRAFLDLGIAGLLVIALVGGFRGWYVWKWQYDALVQERDEWKAVGLRALNAGERATEVAEGVVKVKGAISTEVARGYQERG